MKIKINGSNQASGQNYDRIINLDLDPGSTGGNAGRGTKFNQKVPGTQEKFLHFKWASR